MADQGFVRLNAFGLAGAGLTLRPPYPKENLETEPPVHSSHLYVNDEEQGIKIGVWECTPHTSKMGPFPVNEFMILLEGSVTMLEKDGKATTVQAGEAFVVPKGTVCQWRQSEPVRKYFAIQADGLNQTEQGTGQPLAVTKAVSSIAKKRAGQSAGTAADLPFQMVSNIYSDVHCGYSLDVWTTLPKDSRPTVLRSYQMLRVEAGALNLTGKDGVTETFKAGDAVLVTPGNPIDWSGSDDLRVLTCSIKDGRAAALQGAAE